MSATQDVRAPGLASASSVTTATARADAALLKHVLVAIGLSTALTIAVSVVDYIPTQDGPPAVLNAYLELHLRDPGKGYADFLVPNLALTSRAFDAVFTPMPAPCHEAALCCAAARADCLVWWGSAPSAAGFAELLLGAAALVARQTVAAAGRPGASGAEVDVVRRHPGRGAVATRLVVAVVRVDACAEVFTWSMRT